MQATENELRAWGERKQREEERDAVAWLGSEYRRIGNALDVFASYLGRLQPHHRADALAELARRVQETVKGELAVLGLIGHPYVVEPRERKVTRWQRIRRWWTS